nr:MAG TPA_asm: hypothetical protein [Caudoviricetes sp.]
MAASFLLPKFAGPSAGNFLPRRSRTPKNG